MTSGHSGSSEEDKKRTTASSSSRSAALQALAQSSPPAQIPHEQIQTPPSSTPSPLAAPPISSIHHPSGYPSAASGSGVVSSPSITEHGRQVSPSSHPPSPHHHSTPPSSPYNPPASPHLGDSSSAPIHGSSSTVALSPAPVLDPLPQAFTTELDASNQETMVFADEEMFPTYDVANSLESLLPVSQMEPDLRGIIYFYHHVHFKKLAREFRDQYLLEPPVPVSELAERIEHFKNQHADTISKMREEHEHEKRMNRVLQKKDITGRTSSAAPAPVATCLSSISFQDLEQFDAVIKEFLDQYLLQPPVSVSVLSERIEHFQNEHANTITKMREAYEAKKMRHGGGATGSGRNKPQDN